MHCNYKYTLSFDDDKKERYELYQKSPQKLCKQEESGVKYFKYWEGKKKSILQNSVSCKIILQKWGIKTFSGKQKLREFIASRGFPGGASGKEPTCQSRRYKRCGFDSWVGRSPGRGHSNPAHYSCLQSPMDRGAWWVRAHSVAESQTWLKWLSMHTRAYVGQGVYGNSAFCSVFTVNYYLKKKVCFLK